MAFVLVIHDMIVAIKLGYLQVWEKPKGQPGFWRPAKNWTKKEFIHNFDAVIDAVHERAEELGLEHVRWRFAFDNPNNHKVKRSDLKNLRDGEEIVQPPRYSPEIMQPVEHSHGYTQARYFKDRLEANMHVWDIQAEWALLQEAFYKANTPETVTATVRRVPEAAQQIVKAKGGRIARKYR